MPATLALVADRWPPERRALPLGVVGAVQEAGAVLGPLAGAAVLAVADWRAIFWLNLLLGARPGRRGARHRPGRRPDPVGLVLAAVAVARARRCSWPRRPRSPRTSPSACSTCRWSPSLPASTPLVLVAVVAGRRRWSPAAWRARPARCCRCAGCARLAAEVDVLGSALVVVALGSLVWAFAAADPATAGGGRTARCCCRWPWSPRSPSCCASAGRPTRCCRCAALRPTGAWGALLVNLLVGVALVAALVDVPLFARNTTTPGDQLGAALVLLRLLVAVPVGAVAGGWLCRLVAAAAGRGRRAWR